MPVTVYQAFSQAAQKWPNKPFLHVARETAAIYNIDSGDILYQEAFEQVESLKQSYQDAGYGYGHRVGLLLENRPAFFNHWFALNALGVSVVPINADMRASELEYLIGHSEICLAVALESRHALLADAAKAINQKLVLISANQTPKPAPIPAPATKQIPNKDTECALLYTSGTTGRPKGCVLSNLYYLHAGHWYANIGGLATLKKGQERMLTPLPLVHMNAMACSTMAMITTGGCLIALDRFHPRSFWDTVRETQASIVHYLGVMPAILMKAAASPNDKNHQLRFGFGAGVDPKLHIPFEERFGFPLLEAWAMTETGNGAVVIANREPRFAGTACFGKEGPDVLVKLIDDDGQEVTTPYVNGQLLVKHAGPNPRYGFFTKYLKDEEATAEAWQDGWFHTGDIVHRNAEGYLIFVDREKNVIRRSGENISAVEVESVLLQHPAIKAAAVAATPDAIRGDEVLACIVCHTHPKPDEKTDLATEIVQFCLERLAYFKVPGYIAFVTELPLTSTNKIQRGELQKMAEQLPKQSDCINTTALKKRQEVNPDA